MRQAVALLLNLLSIRHCVQLPAYLADKAGFVKGALNVVVSENAKMVGEIMTESERVRKFTFTGSTGVGSNYSLSVLLQLRTHRWSSVVMLLYYF